MPHTLTILPQAERQLRKLQRQPDLLTTLDEVIRRLALEPRPPGCRKIEARPGHWRVRVRDHRVIYRIDNAGNLVEIVAVLKRDEHTYKR